MAIKSTSVLISEGLDRGSARAVPGRCGECLRPLPIQPGALCVARKLLFSVLSANVVMRPKSSSTSDIFHSASSERHMELPRDSRILVWDDDVTCSGWVIRGARRGPRYRLRASSLTRLIVSVAREISLTARSNSPVRRLRFLDSGSTAFAVSRVQRMVSATVSSAPAATLAWCTACAPRTPPQLDFVGVKNSEWPSARPVDDAQRADTDRARSSTAKTRGAHRGAAAGDDRMVRYGETPWFH
jgi:hypothetical protein